MEIFIVSKTHCCRFVGDLSHLASSKVPTREYKHEWSCKPPSQVRSSQWFLRASRRRDEKLIKVGSLEVPKRDNSREKLQVRRFA